MVCPEHIWNGTYYTSITVLARGEAAWAVQLQSALVVSNHSLAPSLESNRQTRRQMNDQNYSSTSVLRINIPCKNTPSSQEQKNQQVQQPGHSTRKARWPAVFRTCLSKDNLIPGLLRMDLNLWLLWQTKGGRAILWCIYKYVLLVCKMHPQSWRKYGAH